MKRPNIELRRLRHVVTAAEHGAFRRAASALTNCAPAELARLRRLAWCSKSAAVGQGKRAILLRSGLRHFCAGADVGLFNDRIDAKGRGVHDPVETLRSFELLPIPIVAAVHGACLGGGLELALACDYIVAGSSAKIGSVEVALGLHPLLGGVQRQVQRIGATRQRDVHARPPPRRWHLG
jgi:enoyl-CoA hydratase/carnithine racemase